MTCSTQRSGEGGELFSRHHLTSITPTQVSNSSEDRTNTPGFLADGCGINDDLTGRLPPNRTRNQGFGTAGSVEAAPANDAKNVFARASADEFARTILESIRRLSFIVSHCRGWKKDQFDSN